MSSERIYHTLSGEWVGIDDMDDFSNLLPDWFAAHEISATPSGLSFEESFVPTDKPNIYKAIDTDLEYHVTFDTAGNVSRFTLITE